MSSRRDRAAAHGASMAVAVAVALLAGCVALDAAPQPLVVGDPAVFATDVQPVLAHHCANPSCHGRQGTLALYAVGLFRLPPRPTYAVDDLDAAELLHNRRELQLRIPVDDALASPLIGLALGPADGRDGHSFGPIFADAHDPDFQRLRAWIVAAAVAP